MTFFWKFLKFVLWVLLGLAVLLAVLFASVPWWFGPVVRPSLNELVPHFTKTDFGLRRLYLNPYSCHISLAGLRIENPEGFSEPDALRLGGLDFDVDALSLATNIVVIENLSVKDLYFSYLMDDQGRNNFDVISGHCEDHHDKLMAEVEPDELTGWRQLDDYLESFRASTSAGVLFSTNSASLFSTNAVALFSTNAVVLAESDARRKLIVQHLELLNISGTYRGLSIGVPSIVLDDVGAGSGGYDFDQLVAKILREIVFSLFTGGTDVIQYRQSLEQRAQKARQDAERNRSQKQRDNDHLRVMSH